LIKYCKTFEIDIIAGDCLGNENVVKSD